MKKLLMIMNVNPRQWRKPKTSHPKNELGWRRFRWDEIILNWAWFPKNCYGKLVIEMKRSGIDANARNKYEACLAWQKALRDGGRKEPVTFLEGSEVSDDIHYAWELYESDYFPLPAWDGPVIVWLYGRADEDAEVNAAMWSLAIFEEVDES